MLGRLFCTTSLQVFFGLPLGLPPSISYSIPFFTQSFSSFCITCPYHCNPFCCSTEIMSSNPSLSLNFGYTRPCWHLVNATPDWFQICHRVWYRCVELGVWVRFLFVVGIIAVSGLFISIYCCWWSVTEVLLNTSMQAVQVSVWCTEREDKCIFTLFSMPYHCLYHLTVMSVYCVILYALCLCNFVHTTGCLAIYCMVRWCQPRLFYLAVVKNSV